MLSDFQPVERFTRYLLSDLAPLGALLSIRNPQPSQPLSPFPRVEGFDSMRRSQPVKFNVRASKFPKGDIEQPHKAMYGGAPSGSPARETDNFVRPVADRSLALDWLLTPKSAEPSLSERVLARLIQSEAHEAEASFRDDYRIAWITVMHAAKGDAVLCPPHVLATWQVLGCHPDDVYPRTMIRRAAMFGTEANRLKFPAKSSPKKKERKRA